MQLREVRTNLSVLDQNAIDLTMPRISEAGVADYIALLKPRVMSLVVFTALVGYFLAPGHAHPVMAFTSILCIAVGGGASGALNMWYEGDIDALMTRTANRPIPRGRVTRPEALTFGMTLAFFAVMTLGILVNWIAGALLAFTIFFYVVIYTMVLKRWTAQNIVIGGAADHDVLRGPALQHHGVDHDVEEDREREQRPGDPVDEDAERHHREERQRHAERQRFRAGDAAARDRPVGGARHQGVDVALERHVERA